MPSSVMSYAVSAVFSLAVLLCLSFALFFIFEYRSPA
jgi:hypothetical protein